MGKIFTEKDIKKIARLSRLNIDKAECKFFSKQFNLTIKVVENLDELQTENVPETSQVTGLTNVFRDDQIDRKNMLSQSQALSNAKRVYKGFFVVRSIFE